MSIQQPIMISSDQYKIFLGLLLGIDQVHDFKKENRLAIDNILAILLEISETVSPLPSTSSSKGGAGEDSDTPMTLDGEDSDTPMTVDLSQIPADGTPSSFSPVTTPKPNTTLSGSETPRSKKAQKRGYFSTLPTLDEDMKPKKKVQAREEEFREEETQIMEDDSTNPSASVLEDFNASLFVIFIDYLFSINFWNFKIPNEAEILKMIPVNLLSYEKLLYFDFLTFFYKNLEDKNLNLEDNLSKFIEESSFKHFSESFYTLILSKGIPSVEDDLDDDKSMDLDGGMKRHYEYFIEKKLPPIKRKQFRSFRRPESAPEPADEPSLEDTEMVTAPESAPESAPEPAAEDSEMGQPASEEEPNTDTGSEAGPSEVNQLDNNELEASLIQWIKDVNSFNPLDDPLNNFDEKATELNEQFPDQVLDYLLEKFNEIIHTTKGKHANKKKILQINYNLMKLAFLQDDISNTYAEDITKTEQDNDDSNIISELKKLIDKKSDREIQPLVWPGGARARASKTNNIQTKEICKVITNEKTRDLFNIKSIYPGSQYFSQWQAIGKKGVTKSNVDDNEEIAKPQIVKQIKTNRYILHPFTQPKDVSYIEYAGVFWDCTEKGSVSVDCAEWVPPGNSGDDPLWLLKFIYFNQNSFEMLKNKYVKLLYFISILESIFNKFNKFNTDQSDKSKLDDKIKKNIITIKRKITDFKKLLNDFLKIYNQFKPNEKSNICIFDIGEKKTEFPNFLNLMNYIYQIEFGGKYADMGKIANTIDSYFLVNTSFTWPEKEGLACEELLKCMMTKLNEKLSNNSGEPTDSYSEALKLIKDTLDEVIKGNNIKEEKFREKFLKIPNLFNKTTYQKASKPIGEDTEKILTFLTKDTQIPQDAIGEVNESIITGNKNEFIGKKTHFFINNAVQGSGVWPWPAFRICSIGSILDSAGPQVQGCSVKTPVPSLPDEFKLPDKSNYIEMGNIDVQIKDESKDTNKYQLKIEMSEDNKISTITCNINLDGFIINYSDHTNIIIKDVDILTCSKVYLKMIKKALQIIKTLPGDINWKRLESSDEFVGGMLNFSVGKGSGDFLQIINGIWKKGGYTSINYKAGNSVIPQFPGTTDPLRLVLGTDYISATLGDFILATFPKEALNLNSFNGYASTSKYDIRHRKSEVEGGSSTVQDPLSLEIERVGGKKKKKTKKKKKKNKKTKKKKEIKERKRKYTKRKVIIHKKTKIKKMKSKE